MAGTMADQRSPRSGDVVFVRSSGKEGVASGLIQRRVLGSSTGPLFSHVAIALTPRLVIEASTAVEANETTWSGAVLGEGVRLQLLPDLVFGARTFVVLRHPAAPDVSDTFDIHAPEVSRLLGNGYSIKPLIEKAKARLAVISAFIPDDLVDWSAPPDTIAQQLRDAPHLRAGLERQLRQGEALDAMNDYFCSQLVATLLQRSGLARSGTEWPTPCRLFDELVAAGWANVSEVAYGPETVAAWNGRPRAQWKQQFAVDTASAKKFRDDAHAGPMLDLLGEMMDGFSNQLDATTQALLSRHGAAKNDDGAG